MVKFMTELTPQQVSDLIRVLQAERRRWNAVREYAYKTKDDVLNLRLDEISADYRRLLGVNIGEYE